MHRHPRGNSHGCVLQPENMMRAPVRAEPPPEGRGDGGRRPGSPKRPAVSLSRYERALGRPPGSLRWIGSIRWRNLANPPQGNRESRVEARLYVSSASLSTPTPAFLRSMRQDEKDPRFRRGLQLAQASLISTSTPAARSSFISASTVCGVGCTMSSMRL